MEIELRYAYLFTSTIETCPSFMIDLEEHIVVIMADYHQRGLVFLVDPSKVLEEFKRGTAEGCPDARV